MEKQEYYTKLEETVSKFKNGKELYRDSATFNRVVQMLVRDVSPLEIIEQLIMIEIDMAKAFETHIIMDNRPFRTYINPTT